MRSGCFFKGLLFLLVLIGAWEGWSWLETKKSRLAEIRAQGTKISETMASMQKKWKAIELAQTDLKVLRQHEGRVQKERDKISEQQRRLTGEIKYLALSMREAVTKVRTAAVDTKVEELKLMGRASLTNARILKITDDSITFLHEDGVANLKLESAELPEPLAKKFDIGPSGLSTRLERLDKAL